MEPMQLFELMIAMLLAIIGLHYVAHRLALPPAVALLTGGALLAFIPGLPVIALDPELVLVIFLLPPLMDGAWFIALGLSVMIDVAEMLLIDLAGNQICSTTIPGSGLTLTDTIAELGRFLEAAQAQYQVDPVRIHAISIALAGYYVGEGDFLTGKAR
ncbi:hypothetical protein [Sphingobium phenoxybenzoativorans]|uniref:hypothetical protein n=1 Tax=Sphingobium phenoxybenzoativorans TaxID=1592790 RepID=UPI001FE9DB36|nr:hypothetical protein [Sphingobium phenoxybenzoativorans]